MNLRHLYRRVFPEKTPIDFPGAYIPAHYVVEGVGTGRNRAIVIGDLIGRDYTVLKQHFSDVKAIDVVDTGYIPKEDLILQDASERTTLPPDSVDYVVACNVLEHMYGDMACLVEMNRVLKTGGRFFIDTPYFADSPYFHYRLYSPLIFHRMLEKAGYKVLESSYRGLVVSINNNVFAALCLLFYPIFKKSTISRLNSGILSLHKALSRSYYLNRPVSAHFGGYIVCEKVSDPIDETITQKEHFGISQNAE